MFIGLSFSSFGWFSLSMLVSLLSLIETIESTISLSSSFRTSESSFWFSMFFVSTKSSWELFTFSKVVSEALTKISSGLFCAAFGSSNCSLTIIVVVGLAYFISATSLVLLDIGVIWDSLIYTGSTCSFLGFKIGWSIVIVLSLMITSGSDGSDFVTIAIGFSTTTIGKGFSLTSSISIFLLLLV